jgi:hypothetical protein
MIGLTSSNSMSLICTRSSSSLPKPGLVRGRLEKGASLPSRERLEFEPLDLRAEIESFDLRDALRAIGDEEELEPPPGGINEGVLSSDRSPSSKEVAWAVEWDIERLGERFWGDISLLSLEGLEDD